MSLSIGIIGLPNVGKSTLFNALLKRQAALAANYPFATIEPNIGIVDVPDERLEKLAEIVRKDFERASSNKEIPEKIIPAVVKFVDIAGLVKGASEGEGLGNKFLSHIREADALVHVVRAFEDENIARAGSTNPKDDIEIINTELILADMQVLEKRIDAEQRLARANNKESFERLKVYEKLIEVLNAGKLASSLDLNEDELILIKDLSLLTLKPTIYLLNMSEDALGTDIENTFMGAELKSLIGDSYVKICAGIEAELVTLSEDEQEEYKKELGIQSSGLDKVIKRGYELLNLQTFLTAGPKEVRAWTIKIGDRAPQAAGVIHSDFERGFISAEVVNFKDLYALGSYKEAKSKGLIRIEGKEYVMQEGDVVEFRFSV